MTTRLRSRNPLPAAPWRALAGLLAVLVVVMGLASASPQAHAWMHGGEASAHEACTHSATPAPDTQHADHVCAVVLFAQGIDLPFETVFLAQPSAGLTTVILTPDALYLAQPRYLRQPERGPPLA